MVLYEGSFQRLYPTTTASLYSNLKYILLVLTVMGDVKLLFWRFLLSLS